MEYHSMGIRIPKPVHATLLEIASRRRSKEHRNVPMAEVIEDALHEFIVSEGMTSYYNELMAPYEGTRHE